MNDVEHEHELDQLRQGPAGVSAVFSRHRESLRRMIRFRMDERLLSRIDYDDVLQEAFIQTARRIDDFLECPTVPFFVWCRQITTQVLIDTHRRHLGAKRRDAKLEVSLSGLDWSHSTSCALAEQLAGNLTSPSEAAVRDEIVTSVHVALQQMNQIDREVLVLRHLEDLSNQQVAEVLGLKSSTASRRYLRALERLRHVLTACAER